jgi:transcriptional regulator with XRE-family HTH domain
MSERKPMPVRPVTEHERFRRLRGHSITSLADAIGRSRIWVSRIENGHERPSPSYRRDVAHVLGVPEDLIFTHESAKPAVAGSKASRSDPDAEQTTEPR